MENMFILPEIGARRDEDGYFWVMGRVDDVINVAGTPAPAQLKLSQRWFLTLLLPKPLLWVSLMS
jgi:hypothetical protein